MVQSTSPFVPNARYDCVIADHESHYRILPCVAGILAAPDTPNTDSSVYSKYILLGDLVKETYIKF